MKNTFFTMVLLCQGPDIKTLSLNIDLMSRKWWKSHSDYVLVMPGDSLIVHQDLKTGSQTAFF